MLMFDEVPPTTDPQQESSQYKEQTPEPAQPRENLKGH